MDLWKHFLSVLVPIEKVTTRNHFGERVSLRLKQWTIMLGTCYFASKSPHTHTNTNAKGSSWYSSHSCQQSTKCHLSRHICMSMSINHIHVFVWNFLQMSDDTTLTTIQCLCMIFFRNQPEAIDHQMFPCFTFSSWKPSQIDVFNPISNWFFDGSKMEGGLSMKATQHWRVSTAETGDGSFRVTFLGVLSDLFQGLNDLHLGRNWVMVVFFFPETWEIWIFIEAMAK